MPFIPSIVTTIVTLFKANPKRLAVYVSAAIGALTVAAQVIEQVVLPVIYQAIEVLKQVLVGLS